MATVGRRQLVNPALGTTGGAGLYTSVETIYTNIANDLSGRYFEFTAVANSAVTTVTHNFGAQFADYKVYLYTGSWPSLTRIADPVASGYTIAANGTNPKTQIDITAPSSGGPFNLAVFTVHGRGAEKLKDLDDIDFSTAPQDGQALVYNNTTSKWVPGASGDASFKVQSVTTPNASIKGGYVMLDDGRELATYSGSGATSTSYGVDLTVSLTTILGSSPANATAYYLYLDLTTIGTQQVVTDTGRKLYQITVSNFVLSTNSPDNMIRSRYVARAVIKSATTGNAWSGAGSSFQTLAFLGANTLDFTAVTSLTKNYLFPASAESEVSLWSAYANTAGVTPVTGTGGSPTVTFTRNTTTPINGIADFKFSKTAVNSQGQGASRLFSIPVTDKSRKVSLTCRYNATNANYADGDLGIFIYDVTNSALISPVVTAINKTSSIFTTSFDLTTGVSYRFIVHVTSVNATAYDVYFDDFEVTPGQTPQGAVVSASTSYVPAYLPVSGNISPQWATYQRVGDSMIVEGRVDFLGAGGAGQFVVPLPTGFTLDTSKVTATAASIFGLGNHKTTVNYSVQFEYFTTTSFAVRRTTAANFSYAGTDFANGDSLNFKIRVPIAEWAGSGTSNLAQNDVEYVSNSSTSTSSGDTTSFISGPRGSLIGNITASLNRRVRFQTAIQSTDQLIVQVAGVSGRWITLASRTLVDGANNICDFTDQNGQTYGVGRLGSVNATDVDVYFGTYATDAGGTYGAAGSSWSAQGASAVYWRVVKCSSGQAIGFGQVTQKSSGLVKSAGQLLGTNTNDTALVGYVGETLTNSANSVALGNTIFSTPFSIVLTAGHWIIKAYGYFAGVAGATNAQIGISTDSGNTTFSDIGGSTSPTSSNFASSGGLATADTGVQLNTTVKIATTTNYYIKLRSVGNSTTVGGYLEAIRIR